MGQCNTLPADIHNPYYDGAEKMAPVYDHQHKPKSSSGYKGASVANVFQQSNIREQRDVMTTKDSQTQNVHRQGEGSMMMVQPHLNSAAYPQRNSKGGQYQTEDAKYAVRTITNRQIMKGEGKTNTPVQSSQNPCFPVPPDGAVRTRCYRLNLNCPPISSPTNSYYGPFDYNPSLHVIQDFHSQTTSSRHDIAESATMHSDKTTESTKLKVAINTALIFRDLVVTEKGTIVSNNPRANRGQNGKKTKEGEKSRQAAKIDKAKDLIDDIGSGSGMVSIQKFSHL